MPETTRDGWNTVTTATFGMSLDGVELGRFTSVKGLEIRIETESAGQGTQQDPLSTYPTRASSPEIELTRPIDANTELERWVARYAQAPEGKFPKYAGEIVLFSGDLKRLRVWNFEGAVPVSWTITDFSADSEAGVVYETLTIAHDGFVQTIS